MIFWGIDRNSLVLPGIYINADDLQREHQVDAATAQRAAAELRAKAIAMRRDVMYETVMSHPSKVGELQQAKAAGYRIAIHVVATEDPTINVQRVALRVAAGEHDVPEDRFRQRYQRTLTLLPAALGYADEAIVFDNTRRGDLGGLELQAQFVDERLVLATDRPAGWVTLLTQRIDQRVAEVAQVRQMAMGKAMKLEAANLLAGQSDGPVEFVGGHFVLQRDLQSQGLVLHDRPLLSPGVRLAQGTTCRIGYSEGVSAIDGLQPSRDRPAASSPSRGDK